MSDPVELLTADTFDQAIGSLTESVLVDFWAEWCAPCIAYEPVIAEVADAYAGRLRVGRVDIVSTPEIAERWGVRTVPTLVLFQNGEPVKRIFGARGKRVLLDELGRFLD